MKRAAAIFILLLALSTPWWLMIRMPGKSFHGNPPPLSIDEVALRDELMRHVQKLAGEIGERNVQHYSELVASADYIEQSFREAGLRTRRDGYELAGKHC